MWFGKKRLVRLLLQDKTEFVLCAHTHDDAAAWTQSGMPGSTTWGPTVAYPHSLVIFIQKEVLQLIVTHNATNQMFVFVTMVRKAVPPFFLLSIRVHRRCVFGGPWSLPNDAT